MQFRSHISPKHILRRYFSAWRVLQAFILLYPLLNLPGLPLPNGLLQTVVLCAVSLGLLAASIATRPHRFSAPSRKAADWLLLLFLCLTAASTILSIRPSLSLLGIPGEYQGLVPWLSYGALFFATSRLSTPERTQSAIQSMVIGSVIPAIYGILQHTHLFPAIPYQSRITSLFLNADFCGTYFGLILTLAIGLFLQSPSRRQRTLYLALTILLFLALVFSFTRSAWLGTGIALVWLFGRTAARGKPMLAKWASVALTFGIAFAIVNHQSHHQITSRAQTIAVDAKRVATNQDRLSTGSDRWFIWVESLPMIQQHPLVGTGPDTFEAAFHPPAAGAKAYLDNQPMANANNNYIQVAVTLGLPGFVVFLAFLGVSISPSFRRCPRRRRTGRPLLPALQSALIGYLIQALFNIDVIMVAPYFWMVLALAGGRERESET